MTRRRDPGSRPMIDLHRHLEGSVRPGTLRELAGEAGLGLTAARLRRRSTMAGARPGFLRFLSRFEILRGLFPSREWIERVAFEAAEDAARDGVVYLELRFSPAFFARRMKARGEDVAGWVAGAARRAGIPVRFIATFGRHVSLEENRPTFRAVQGTEVFSGLDVAGDERRSAAPFLPFFRRAGLPVTIHAGEKGGPDNVREAIERFGARRIGHGVRVLEDPRVLRMARERGIVFETCLTGEIQTGAARSWDRHPARLMMEAGLRVTLNTDDPSVSGIRLSDEFRRARRAGFTEADLRRATLEAARAAFLAPAARSRLETLVERRWPAARGCDNSCTARGAKLSSAR